MSTFSRLLSFVVVLVFIFANVQSVAALPVNATQIAESRKLHHAYDSQSQSQPQSSPSTPESAFTGSTGPSRGGNVGKDGSGHGDGLQLLNVLSNNGGDGGKSESGDARVNCKRDGPAPGAYTGATGDVSGGDTSGSNSWINLLSGNGGPGGLSQSGDSTVCPDETYHDEDHHDENQHDEN
ncbi:hypothetical protein BDP27DRAFT_1318124 [Rhodocollybia butyracea]|uniref:Uncharacterized protein n=1 Tax=Rhodocollybia butyracea TaxID=206335 RepID=A0A9P5Q561_9AGAR|nr:hypothetical protein BDP27DRAFT_1318124 [Rhodocollybia butyracea]